MTHRSPRTYHDIDDQLDERDQLTAAFMLLRRENEELRKNQPYPTSTSAAAV